MLVKCPSCKLIFNTNLASRTQVKCKCGKSFGRWRNSVSPLEYLASIDSELSPPHTKRE